MLQINFDLLDSLDGIADVIDPCETIIHFTRNTWILFAAANGGEELCDETRILGHNLLDFVQGDEVRDAYQRFNRALFEGRMNRVVLSCTCDAPAMQRKMRFAITPIRHTNAVQALLYHSVVLDEHIRPPIELFDFQAMNQLSKSELELPTILMCSYCQRVQFPVGSTVGTKAWITTEEYYRRGGTSAVKISHGVCSDCVKTFPQFN